MSVRLELIQTRNYVEALIMVLISFLFAIIAILLFIQILGFMGYPIDLGDLVFYTITDVFSDFSSILQILYWSSPLMLTGLAVAVAFQAGLFNIGGQGQMMLGGVFSAIWAAVIVPQNLSFLNFPIFVIPTTILMGIIGGGIWGFIPGYLKAKTGAHEVIVTIMMNLIAISLVTYLIGSQSYSPFIDKSSVDAYSQTDKISKAGQIGLIFPNETGFLNWTTLLTIIIVIIVHLLLFDTNLGFKIRAVGFNKSAAENAGIQSEGIIIRSMTLAGALAGLAGTFYVMGTPPYRYVGGFEGTLGFDGIAVALIAQNSPLPIILAALFFGLLTVSKNNLDFSNIPPDLIFTLQAWVIIFVAAPLIARRFYNFVQRESKEVTDTIKHQMSDQQDNRGETS